MSTVAKDAAPQASGIKGMWEGLSAGTKKNVTIAAGLSAVLVMAWVVVGSGSVTSSGPKSAKAKIENALLPTEGARDLSAASITSELRKEQERNRSLQGDMARLKAMVERQQSTGAASADQRLQSELDEMRRRTSELEKRLSGQGAPQGKGSSQPSGANAAAGPGGPRPGVPGQNLPQQAPPPPPAYGGIRTISADPKQLASPAKSAQVAAPTVPQFYLPSGAMIEGVLLSGVDAATGKSALKDPVPVLARIKHDAILPNRYRADVKECFVLLEAVGDLPAERAYLRSTNLSCVRNDRSVIDVELKGYSVGEDGKAGLRGVLVSKQGAALARATLAAFAEGVSHAFGQQSNTLLRGNGGINEQQIDYGNSLQSGAVSGTASALDRIAKYYLDLADQLHPVIEIESGRKIVLVVIKGKQLATVNSSVKGKP